MNEIINALFISMLSGSIASLFVSLSGTIKAYKKHTKAKKELEISKKNRESKMEEVLNTQKEIIKIIDSMKSSDKDLAIEVLEKTKKELEESCHKDSPIE